MISLSGSVPFDGGASSRYKSKVVRDDGANEGGIGTVGSLQPVARRSVFRSAFPYSAVSNKLTKSLTVNEVAARDCGAAKKRFAAFVSSASMVYLCRGVSQTQIVD